MWSRLTEWIARRADRLAGTPVLIPVFNNATYLRGMLTQLAACRLRNVVVIDNASTAPDMLALLDAIGGRAKVVRLRENRGPRDIVGSDERFAQLPDLFCVTDPDLVFNPALPRDFLAELLAISEQFRIGKVGFSLDISDRQALRDEDFRIGDASYKIWEWEAKHWAEQIGTTARGDPLYKAEIDTTFALYNKRYFDRARQYEAIRVAGRYTCRHLPWYKDAGMPAAEEALYRATQKFSYYLAAPGDGTA